MRFLAPDSSSATSTSRMDTSPGIAPKIDRAQDTSERTGRNHSGTASLMQELGAAAAYAKVQKTSQQVAAGDLGACLMVLLFPARRLCCPRTSTSVSLLVSTKSLHILQFERFMLYRYQVPAMSMATYPCIYVYDAPGIKPSSLWQLWSWNFIFLSWD